jgi:hypothetical protein
MWELFFGHSFDLNNNQSFCRWTSFENWREKGMYLQIIDGELRIPSDLLVVYSTFYFTHFFYVNFRGINLFRFDINILFHLFDKLNKGKDWLALNQDNVSEWSFCFIAVTDLNKIFGFTIFRLLAYPQFLVGFVLLVVRTYRSFLHSILLSTKILETKIINLTAYITFIQTF